MSSPHDAFKALGPIDWNTIDQDDLASFMLDTFSEAQCLIDSIPVSLSTATKTQGTTGRPRSATDPSVKLPGRAPKTSDRAAQLRKEWKEVQVNPRDNPLGVNVYRANAAKSDRRGGAWFARRSVHEGLTFERWKLGMQREFAETLKVQGKPGDGKIRGIGADKRVVNTVVDGCGKMEIYQLSAQFPGPTAPRDFVTLLLSSDSAIDAPMQEGLGLKPRYFMVISKPCQHPSCPQRSGYIRGQYESVEFIREIKVEKPLRKVHSSIDLGNEEAAAARRDAIENLGKEATLRSARNAALSSTASDIGEHEGRKRGKTITLAGSGQDGASDDKDDDENYETMVEWLMVTRSDPGGSVPRFMVEKGTPAGIAGDANKFLSWVSSMRMEDVATDDEVDYKMRDDAAQAEEMVGEEKRLPTAEPTHNLITHPAAAPGSIDTQEQISAPSGFYGMIASALGVAGSVVTSRLPNPFGSAKGGDTDSDLSPEDRTIDDDSSSIHSFHSFGSAGEEGEKPARIEVGELPVITPSGSIGNGEAQSTHSSESVASKSASKSSSSHHEKELRKLEERRRKMQDKMERAQQRALAKKEQESQRDEVAVAKLRERHEREIARQEEKYQRELRRLEEKREGERRKAEDRRRKAAEREDRANLALELDKVRAERDVALKQIEMLKEQVGSLQAQNTMLVRQMGKQSRPDGLDALKRTNTGLT